MQGIDMFKRALCFTALISTGCAEDDATRSMGDETASPGAVGGKADDLGQLEWPAAREGDLDRMVVTLQYLLRDHGHSVPLTGRFGPETTAVVLDFQRQRGLTPDGVVGSRTWESLVRPLEAEDEGDAVKAVQDQLVENHQFDLSISGVFDVNTAMAVAEFQDDACLDASATVGLETWHAFVSKRSSCVPDNAAGRLLQLHEAGTITLWDRDFSRGNNGADPLSNITDAAQDRPAKCSPGAPCSSARLSAGLLEAMVELTDGRGYRYFVTSISGAFHSQNSFHYDGRAFDIDEVNGTLIRGDSSIAREFMNACRSVGAIEVLGPSNDPSGHSDHIHCAF